MTPIEKAETALNGRIERIQAALAAAKSERERQFLVQSLVVSIGLGEALTDYVRMIGQYAQARHGGLKQTHDTLTAQHADLLSSGKELLERFKADPTDRAIRQEIEQTQRRMAVIQKTLKRGANALQRDVAPSTATIDPLALSLRRLCEAGEIDALKRATKAMIGHVGDLYRAQPGLPVKAIVDGPAWENSAASEIDAATDSHEAYARAGYQAMLALDLMTLAVSPSPPRTPEEAAQRAGESIAARLKAITARFAGG